MNYTQLLEEVKSYALHFFQTHNDPAIVYHNQSHTEHVVQAAAEAAGYYNLNEHDRFVVLTAAWFHDAGYYTGPAQGHEQRAVELVSLFLKERGVDEDSIKAIDGCIMATRLPQSPANLQEQIVCDADLSHLGSDEFDEKNKLLRKEVENINHKHISKDEWRKGTIRFLESTHYHTEYARQTLNGKKQQNLDKLKHKLSKDEAPPPKKPVITPPPPQAAPVKKPKIDRPERGIETMFRISSANHQRLSDMADNKAHIMITTTSIILSVVLSVLLRKLEDNPYLIFPTVLLLIICVVTMVFSILATRPSIPPGRFTQQDIEQKKVNLLFFGNFYRMSYNEYLDGMKAMMNDRDFLYGSLIRDVYSQGVVLGRKYRLLRIAYSVFMFGIVAAVLAFTIATIFFAH
ncbi:MAG TPA: Pycsar system effector family protein [Chitinophagaceae bacterium]|jgi:predicted metal-dependent HD superfamily phosphohydrolase